MRRPEGIHIHASPSFTGSQMLVFAGVIVVTRNWTSAAGQVPCSSSWIHPSPHRMWFSVFSIWFSVFFHRFLPLPEFAQVHEFVVFRNLCFLVYLPVRGGGGCAGIVLWVDPVRWPSGVVPGRGNSMCNWEFISRQRLIYISSCGDGVGGIAGRSAGEQDTGWSVGRCCNY